MEGLIVLIIISIFSSLIRGGVKKSQKKPNDWVKRAIEEATRSAGINSARNPLMNWTPEVPEDAPPLQGEGSVQSEGFAFGEEESFLHQPVVQKAPQDVAGKRRPMATARPAPAQRQTAWAEGAGGTGSMARFDSTEGECAPDHAHTGPGTQMDLGGLDTQMDLGRLKKKVQPRVWDHAQAYSVGKEQKASSLQFSPNPAVNGLIWSEILRRPNQRRRR